MEVLSSAWGQREKMVCSSACSSVGERWLLVSLLTVMVELQVDNSCTATKTTFILAFGWLNTDIVLPGGDGELLSQGGVQLLGGRSSSKVVLASACPGFLSPFSVEGNSWLRV